MSQIIKATQISEKKFQKIHNLQDKTGCQKYKISVTAIAKSTPSNLLILISTKLKNQTLSKVNDSFLKTWLFPFLGHFLHALGIIAFNIKRFFTCFFVYMSQHGKIKWYMYIPSCETVHQTIHRPDWQGLLKT